MDYSRNTGDIKDNVFGDGVNFQGDNVKQSITKITDEGKALFEDLIAKINQMPESQEKRDSIGDVQTAQKVFSEGNKAKAMQLLKKLPDWVKNINAFITLYNFMSSCPPV